LSETLFTVLAEALKAAQLSDGLVTPTTLEALERAGYDSSFEKVKERGATAPTNDTPARPAADYRQISLNATDHTVQRPVGLRLDLGGTGKGWAADRTAARLKGRACALVDVGGDIAVNGPQRDGRPWRVSIASPFDYKTDLVTLLVSRGAVVTSARDYRRWQKEGKWQHHLIDPRTGEPAVTDVMSATVVGPSAREAEAVSKAVLIRGSRGGMAWLESHPEFAGLLVLENRQMLKSSRVSQYLAT
jgi:thiamine biosynthesis lipoprotein